MKKYLFIIFVFSLKLAFAQPHSQQLAQTAMNIWKDSFALPGDKSAKWRYDQGVILKGIEGIWNATGNAKWFDYIQKSMDFYVGSNGSIKGYRPEEYNIDHINNGRQLLMLYRVTGKEKYKLAADQLRNQLKTHPRTSQGGFWHKKIYPSQMWLDGLYMGQPFYAEYASLFGEDSVFNDITRQFVLMEKNARDSKTGLLFHGWDESRKQKWADPVSGKSPHVWGRALGWYGMAMVDVLDYFPSNHPGRDSIIGILNRFVKAISAVQDLKTGLWYDIPNLPQRDKNYVEASASSMLVYTLAKAVRKSYIPSHFLANAQKGYAGILSRFIKIEEGQENLHGTVAVSGLGGNPYRDGSFEYYMSEPVIVNDPKGIGAFINAAVEMELIPLQQYGNNKLVVLDNWFNNEWRNDANGKPASRHYTWNDRTNGGFYLLGKMFENYGATISSLQEAPVAANLKTAAVYIIADPDNEKDTKSPNFMNAVHANNIAEWVKKGGVLILLANDSNNCDIKHFNILAEKFGIKFNMDSLNMVKNDQFEQGAVYIPAGNFLFRSTRKIYVKELSSLTVSPPAKSSIKKDGKNIIAITNYGKGHVFAIGDPWLYNEYLDGRKIPNEFENFSAANDLIKWALKNHKYK
jgi:unsaturated rhamnogalacturonyl hydrolase